MGFVKKGRKNKGVLSAEEIQEQGLSRTQKKKTALSLQDLGERLVKLSDEQLKAVDLPESVLDAVKMAKSIKKHIPLLRQMQYIGTLMRKYDPTPIREFLDALELGNHKRTEDFKKIEKWRDDLIAGNDALIQELVATLPYAEQRELTELVHKAREERAVKATAPKAPRALFRYLTKALQAFNQPAG